MNNFIPKIKLRKANRIRKDNSKNSSKNSAREARHADLTSYFLEYDEKKVEKRRVGVG